MAENAESEVVNLYQPKKRFIIPIDNFHIPKKLFKLFKRNYLFNSLPKFPKSFNAPWTSGSPITFIIPPIPPDVLGDSL